MFDSGCSGSGLQRLTDKSNVHCYIVFAVFVSRDTFSSCMLLGPECDVFGTLCPASNSYWNKLGPR